MIETIDGLSMNIEQAHMDKLKSIFPECLWERGQTKSRLRIPIMQI